MELEKKIKDDVIRIRINKDDKQFLNEEAAKYKMTLSQYCLFLVFKSFEK